MILWFLLCLRWSSLLFRCTCGGERDEKGQIACRRKTERGLLIWTQPKSRTNRKNVKRNTRNIKGLRISICCSHTIHTLAFSVLIFICQLRIPTTRKLTDIKRTRRREEKKWLTYLSIVWNDVKETHKWTGVLVLGVLVANIHGTRTQDATNNDCVF